MKATDMLEQQHREVETLFERYESAKTQAQKVQLFEKIAATLVAHDAIEREIFYPACEREIDEDDVLRESLVEHGVVEFCLFRADKNRNGDKLDSYVKVLKEVVEHHVEEEESELLPKADRAIGEPQLVQLASQMEARFAKALASDFRKPLRDNLQQVLAGRTKTAKAPAKAPARMRQQPRTRASAKKPTRQPKSRASH